jgi:restriction endonuclease S subunit
MKSAYVQDQIENLCTSSTQKNVSMDAIPRIKILYPPMKTQIVVGSFLDKKISGTGSVDRGKTAAAEAAG